MVNSTCLIVLRDKINFQALLENLPCSQLEKNSKFRCVVVRRGKHKGTSRVYENGKVVVLGLTCLANAVSHVEEWLAESQLSNRIISSVCKNLVACCSLPHTIRLENYRQANIKSSSLETEIFPGLFVQVSDRVRATVFHNGKLYVRGTSDLSELKEACENLVAQLSHFPRT